MYHGERSFLGESRVTTATMPEDKQYGKPHLGVHLLGPGTSYTLDFINQKPG